MVNANEIEQDEDQYEEELNEIYGTATVCGYEYDQGTLLREISPTTFRCGLADEPLRYECDECKAVYDNKDEAEDCCEEEE